MIQRVVAMHEGEPEIEAAGIAALAKISNGELNAFSITKKLDPAMNALASLQHLSPKKVDLSKIKIDIETAAPETIKLALITIGLKKNISNILHPRYENEILIEKLCQHSDIIVKQYSVWCIIENEGMTLNNLGIDRSKIFNEPSNVQSKIVQLYAEKCDNKTIFQEILLDGSISKHDTVREGLAKGLLYTHYDGIETATIEWFDNEDNMRIIEHLSEHFARFSDQNPLYMEKSIDIYESHPNVRKNLFVGSARKRLYRELRILEINNEENFSPIGDLFTEERANIMNQTTKSPPQKIVSYLSSSPTDQKHLRLDKETRDIRNEVRSVRERKIDLRFEVCPATRPEDIQKEFLENRPQIVHFSGHGDKDILAFEDANGETHPVESDSVAELFELSKGHVECVILNSCYSESIAKAVNNHVSVVICSTSSILDDAASSFSKSFYRALSHGKPYEEAFQWAKNEVRMTLGTQEADRYFIFKP